ncbi:LysR substrate-binding domain-containing protein [Brucella tritici]|uniref:LysR family transcriptional regulator n=1 Tax=Brucella tritici TaxID=94626 RepID=A0A6L3YMV2_9HYPH|nr:LysR substrate-binding domain-containing protein [Brucella tritici]KAB2684365.1 LysR family transcriptional regulator [Brucella tritici]
MKDSIMSFSGLSLRDLEYIVAIADLGGFGKAAVRCGVSQPALSNQVRKVESTLGITIFERSTRRVLITSLGRGVVRQARRVLEEATKLTKLSTRLKEPFAGQLKFGAISTLGPFFFPRVIGPLRTRYPGTALLLSEGLTTVLLDELTHGDLDVALLSTPIQTQALHLIPLFTEQFVLAAPRGHPASNANGPLWDQIGMEDRLVLSEGHCLRDQALSICSVVDPQRRLATSIQTLKYMVAAGEGCTLLPALSLNADDPFAVRPMAEDGYSRQVAIAWRESDPRAQEFSQLAMVLRTILHGLPVSGIKVQNDTLPKA